MISICLGEYWSSTTESLSNASKACFWTNVESRTRWLAFKLFHTFIVCIFHSIKHMEQPDSPYRSAVLHHGVLHLVTLGDAAREEAALANVIVEMLQTSIPAGMRRTVKNGKGKRADGGGGQNQ